jgi:hypothetical protein
MWHTRHAREEESGRGLGGVAHLADELLHLRWLFGDFAFGRPSSDYSRGAIMSLALVSFPLSDFDIIYDHLRSQQYRNMHLREACQRRGERDLRYLHAVRPKPGPIDVIEGMISGPEILWRYELIRTRTQTQVNVSIDEASPKARERIGARFVRELVKRVDAEKEGFEYYPKRTPGQFYLRRYAPGMSPSHPTCRRAIASGVLDRRFVSLILPWGFQLLCP